MNDDDKKVLQTGLVHAGRSAARFGGSVNPPVKRASTILTDDVSKLYGGARSLYGRQGTEVHETLIEGLQVLEGARFVQLTGNGLGACALALAASVSSGGHILVTDSVYGPTRRFCERYLARMGVGTTFFHPRISKADLEDLIRPQTQAVFMEMPGSLTFEMHDLEPIIEVCKSKDIITILDNTWSAGVFFKPLERGVDISVQALTKYVIGHSDAFGGAAMTNSQKCAANLEATAHDWGLNISPDDAYLAQRGLRSLTNRIEAQGSNGLALAHWLEVHPATETVLHPALTSHPDHHIWRTLYTGSSGLFSMVLKSAETSAVNVFFKKLKLFGFGFSWGGFESLIIPCDPQLHRSRCPEWNNTSRGALIRLSIGLEAVEDLQTDLENALKHLS